MILANSGREVVNMMDNMKSQASALQMVAIPGVVVGTEVKSGGQVSSIGTPIPHFTASQRSYDETSQDKLQDMSQDSCTLDDTLESAKK